MPPQKRLRRKETMKFDELIFELTMRKDAIQREHDRRVEDAKIAVGRFEGILSNETMEQLNYALNTTTLSYKDAAQIENFEQAIKVLELY